MAMSRRPPIDRNVYNNITAKLDETSKLQMYKKIVKDILRKISSDIYPTISCDYTEIKHFKKDEYVTYMSGSNSHIFTATIQYQKTPSNNDIHVLIKFPLENNRISESSIIYDAIEHEMKFYKTVGPSLEKLVHKLTKYDIKHVLMPKFYCHSLKNWLAIQNLEPDGFHALDSRMDLTHDHIKLIFDRYGYFNAYSYLVKTKSLKQFSKFFNQLKKNPLRLIIQSDRFSQNFQTVCSAINKFLKPEEDLTLINRFEKFIAKGKKLLVKYSEKTGKHDTLIHGNLSSNHLMFKNKEGSEKPIDLRFIDWKCVKKGSPVCDLSFCLYSGAPMEVLKNLDEYLKIYHNSLLSTLREFGCETAEIFTYNELLEEWRTYSKFGFLMATQVIFMKCSIVDNEPGGLFSSSDTKLFKTLKYDETKFETMMRGLLNHMVENRYFFGDSDLEGFDVI